VFSILVTAKKHENAAQSANFFLLNKIKPFNIYYLFKTNANVSRIQVIRWTNEWEFNWETRFDSNKRKRL